MKQISPTGDGVTLAIKCNYLPHHNWMVMSSWYSLLKNLPDAKFMILCDKSKSSPIELFTWCVKLDLEFYYTSPDSSHEYDYEINCDTMAVRDWRGFEVCEATSNGVATFACYGERCGNFILSEWINSIEAPFIRAASFQKENMAVNEWKILELWRKLYPIYSMIG